MQSTAPERVEAAPLTRRGGGVQLPTTVQPSAARRCSRGGRVIIPSCAPQHSKIPVRAPRPSRRRRRIRAARTSPALVEKTGGRLCIRRGGGLRRMPRVLRAGVSAPLACRLSRPHESPRRSPPASVRALRAPRGPAPDVAPDATNSSERWVLSGGPTPWRLRGRDAERAASPCAASRRKEQAQPRRHRTAVDARAPGCRARRPGPPLSAPRSENGVRRQPNSE